MEKVVSRYKSKEVMSYKNYIKQHIINYLNSKEIQELLSEFKEYGVGYEVRLGNRGYYKRWNIVKNKVKIVLWDKEVGFYTLVLELKELLLKHPRIKEII
ncbi:MAG: hypothetical protein ACPL1F_04700 [bacterium]